MIFPGSRLWYEGAATDLSLLTEEIKLSGFSGHIVLEFQESLDLIIVSEGEFFKVIEKIGRRIMTTKKYREIWGKCQIKPGRMTVFELPPLLAAKFRGLTHRKKLPVEGGDPFSVDKAVRDQRAAGLTGFLEGISPEGKGLVELEKGTITSCFYSEYQGLSHQGFEAFVRWHESLHRSGHAFSLFLSEYQPGTSSNEHLESMLTEGVDEVTLPLLPSFERLFSSFGGSVGEGEDIFSEGEATDKAYYLLEGEVELWRRSGEGNQMIGKLGAGSVLGLSWLNGRQPPAMTGRASSACRVLAFDRAQLNHILVNSPRFASTLIRKTAGQLENQRRRRMLFGANPRLRDLEIYVLQVLNEDPQRLRDGLTPGELFRELTQRAPFSLPEMDQMVRDLVNAGRFKLSSGRVSLEPDEI